MSRLLSNKPIVFFIGLLTGITLSAVVAYMYNQGGWVLTFIPISSVITSLVAGVISDRLRENHRTSYTHTRRSKHGCFVELFACEDDKKSEHKVQLSETKGIKIAIGGKY